MNRSELIRYLVGELDGEQRRALAAKLAADPRLRGELARLQRAWEGLSAPPSAPAPAVFSARVLARVRAERRGGTAPTRWLPGAAAAAFLVGIALGAGLGDRLGREALDESTGFDEALAAAYGAALAEVSP